MTDDRVASSLEESEAADDAALDLILEDDLETQKQTEPTDIPPKPEDEDEEDDAAQAPTEEIDSGPDVGSIFKRDNVPDEFITALREKFGDDPVDQWALKAGERQGNVDEYSDKVRALESQVSDLQGSGNTAPKEQPSGNTDDAANTEESNHDDLGQVAEMYGDELASPIRANRDQLTQLTGDIERIRQESELRESIAYAIGDMAVERGGISPEQKRAIVDRANKMGHDAPGTFASVSELISKATNAELGEHKPNPRKRVGRAQMTPPSQTPIPERAQTRDEVEDQILDNILGDMN